MKESKEQILERMTDTMPWRLAPQIKPYVLESMEIYAESYHQHRVDSISEDEISKGCLVYMKPESKLIGYGNVQCISNVCLELGEISLFGHNQHYKINHIDKIVEYPSQWLKQKLTNK